MANQNDQGASPATESAIAPVTFPQPEALPRQMRVERGGDRSMPYSRRFPQVRGGICEYCGVIDVNQPSHFQYKLCNHYRGLQLRCSYCPESKDADDVIHHANLNVAENPHNPQELVVWCDSYNCSRAHEQRYNRATA